MSHIKVYKFAAPWCMPCKQLSTNLSFLQQQNNVNEKFSIETVDIEVRPDFAMQHMVRSVPTLVFIDMETDKEINRIIGNPGLEKLKQVFE